MIFFVICFNFQKINHPNISPSTSLINKEQFKSINKKLINKNYSSLLISMKNFIQAVGMPFHITFNIDKEHLPHYDS